MKAFSLFLFVAVPLFCSVIIVKALAPTDITGDGKVDFQDVLALTKKFLTTGNQTEDIDQNQKINSVDFSYVYKSFSTPSPTTSAGCTYPSQVLNLIDWKITLPIGTGTSPTEIKQPALATYVHPTYFIPLSACNGVRFRAPTNGVTTSGSSYPRSELREMANNGTTNASWSATSGTHTMIIDQAVTALPTGKNHVVAGQIHDSSDDVTVFRVEGSNLYLTNGNTTHYKLITSAYQLGTRFQAKFVVSGGNIQAYYNNVLQGTIPWTGSGLYFKAGAYTQSNCSTESSAGATCGENDYGEVQIYGLSVTHQ